MSSSEYQPPFLATRTKSSLDVRHQHAGLVAHERHREQRFDAARAAGEDRDRARGGDRVEVAVAQRTHRANAASVGAAGAALLRTPDGLRPGREHARFLASFADATLASSSMKRMTVSASSRRRGNCTGSPAAPACPPAHHAQPTRRMFLGQFGDLGQRIAVGVDHVVQEVHGQVDDPAESVQSIASRGSASQENPSRTNGPRLRLPRLHTSYGRSGCSPHGLVASYSPSFGTGLNSLARSMKKTPGSPVFHAPARSSRRSRSSFATHHIAGARADEVVVLAIRHRLHEGVGDGDGDVEVVIWEVSSLQVMKARMSGWSTRRMPMLAPRVPPCFTTSVEES